MEYKEIEKLVEEAKKGLSYIQVIRRKNAILEYIRNEIIKSSEHEISAEA